MHRAIYIYIPHISLYLHTQIYIYIYKQTNIHTYIHTHIQTYTHIHTYIHTYTHTYLSTFLTTNIFKFFHAKFAFGLLVLYSSAVGVAPSSLELPAKYCPIMYMYVCMYMYICMYIHICIKNYMYVYVQTFSKFSMKKLEISDY